MTEMDLIAQVGQTVTLNLYVCVCQSISQLIINVSGNYLVHKYMCIRQL